MTDGELVRQALTGQPHCYGELARRWSARVLALCHAKTGSSHAAEDLAQEGLLRGYRALGTLKEPDKFGPWLCGIAQRVCFDWLKNKQTAQVPFTNFGEGCNPADYLTSAAADDQSAQHAEELHRLMQEVERLPEQYREVLMLYYYQDVTYQELAKMLDVSAATINARLTKARALLRQRLSTALEVNHGS